MYKQIKKLADDALALQNKDRMDAVLREISAICEFCNKRMEETVVREVTGEKIEAGTTVVVGKDKKAAKK